MGSPLVLLILALPLSLAINLTLALVLRAVLTAKDGGAVKSPGPIAQAVKLTGGVFTRPKAKRRPVALSEADVWKREQEARDGRNS